MRSLLIPLVATIAGSLTACSADYSLSADEELLVSALSGEEEGMTSSSSWFTGESDAETVDQPPMFRECDAEGSLEAIRAGYDGDGDGTLSESEAAEVWGAREGRSEDFEQRRGHIWEIIGLVYDADDSKSLDDGEMATLYDDFSERCENVHERLLEDFDSDGDGELSEEEMADARDEAESCRQDREGEEGSHGERGGDGDEMGHGGPDGDGLFGDREDPIDRFLSEWDADGDGEVDADEMATMRETVREKIRSGEHMAPPEGGHGPR